MVVFRHGMRLLGPMPTRVLAATTEYRLITLSVARYAHDLWPQVQALAQKEDKSLSETIRMLAERGLAEVERCDGQE